MGLNASDEALRLFGVTLIGMTPENGRKLLLTLLFVLIALLLARIARFLTRRVAQSTRVRPALFWLQQAAHILIALFAAIGVVSIWFDDPTRLTTAAGLVTAGLAFALQRVVTAIAGYFVILRGKTFNVGDRIVMGGVRGDVIALGFMQTTVMEMGQPGPVQGADPAMWVRGRQYTGRIVTITNAKIFDEPVYNYTREFPFLFEELSVPIRYDADRRRAEAILLETAASLSVPIKDLSAEAVAELKRRYFIGEPDLGPRVYFRMTDNWLEMTVRFIVRDREIRDLKNAMTRTILEQFEKAGIVIASATFEVIGIPRIEVDAHLAQQPDRAG